MASASGNKAGPALIINGDDFGYSEAVNRAILEAHRDGVLTSASLMVNGDAARQAVGIARENPGLSVGLHLSLVLGRATLPPREIPHLVDEAGNFSRSPFLSGLKYYFNPRARVELRREMRAQFERFAATGLRFSHVDGHNHLHMHPVIFRELVGLCEEFNVKGLRVVRGEARVHSQITGGSRAVEVLMSTVFDMLALNCSRRLRGRGLTVPPVVHGLLQSGRLSEDYLIKLISRIGAEGGEIYLHPLAPGASPAEQKENPGGERELAALLSPEVRRIIDRHALRLASYETFYL